MTEQIKDIRDYVVILKKRKKYFIIPFVTLFLVVAVIATSLPSIYESSSTILIETQQIPEDMVRSTVTGFADERIQSLTQQILSRSRLWEIVEQFKLYPELQEKYSREEILKEMKDNIKLETISAEIAGQGQGSKRRSGASRPQQPGQVITIAFSVGYRGKNPDTVQKVAGTLASSYLGENLKIREAQAKSTTQFLEAESGELRERINDLGAKIAKFKKEHEGIQPELQQFNLSQTDRLDQEIKQLDNQIRASEDRRIYLEGQLATVKPDSPVISASGERVMDPQTRLRALQVSLADLQSKFSDDHPDIKKVKREMAELEKIVARQGGSPSLKRQKLTQLQAELAQKQGRYSEQHPDVRKLKGEIARLEQQPENPGPTKKVSEAENPAYVSLTTQIEGAKNEVTSLQRQRESLKGKLRMFNQRLEDTPKVEQEYLALQRDYTNATLKYQEVMNKIMEAHISEGMEEHQKGEKFTIIDPASYPEKPVSPKRGLIFLAGFIMSMGAGFGTMALAEQMDHSLHNADELVSLTGQPVLGSITRIETTEDVVSGRHKRRLIWASTGLGLLLAISLFHFLYMDLWIFTAKLLRLMNKYT